MASIKDKLVKNALASKQITTSNSGVVLTTSDENTLTSIDDDALKGIIYNEFLNRGIDPSDLSILSTASLVTNGLVYTLERVAEILSVQNRESSILTAQKSVTLYNQLIQHTDDIMLSRPSELEIFVKIPFFDLERFGKMEGNGKWRFAYSTDNTIQIDGIPFVPKFDLEVLLTKSSSKQEIKVQYETDEGYKTIPTQRIVDSNGYYYGVFKVPFTQLTIVKTERTFSGNQIERFIIDTDNPIHDFILTYKDPELEAPILIDAKLYFTRGSENYLKYRIHNNRKITIEYTYTPTGFRPRSGGKLYITLMTTTGENVKYRGDATVLKSVPDNLSVEYIPVGTEFESKGGRLASDDKEYIRNYVRKLKGSRLRIDTEADLRTYLMNYQGKSTFNPKLIISDIKRVFNIYTLMSFENNNNMFTIPTTSGDVLLPLSKLDKTMIDGTPYYNLNNINIESIQKTSGIRYYLKPDTETPVGPNEFLFNYTLPFHMTYDEQGNFVRCLSESQYNIPYETYCIYDSNSPDVPTRFVNTTLRINDYENNNKERVFSISTEIRSDNESFKLTTENFNAYVVFKTKDERNVRIKLSKLEDQMKDSKYYLHFNMVSNRKVYGRWFSITAEVQTQGAWREETVLIDIEQKDAVLEMYTKNETSPDWLCITKYKCDINIFQDVSRFMYLQSVVTMDGELKLVLCPMVEYDFMQNWRNRQVINEELSKIFDFIELEIYDTNNEYSAVGYTLRDRQETLFTTSIKFMRTHGRSKFLQLGELQLLTNLQVAPKFKVRLINEQYDINKVSSDTNKFLTTHDFETSDLHMNELVKEVLNNNSVNISMLQFVNFGKQYSDILHLLYHNNLSFSNTDIPESVSLRPKFDDTLGVYVYDVEYEII